MKVLANKVVSSHSSSANQGGILRRMIRSACASLRRGIELSGEKYMNGMLPPL